ncbi:MAG: hypothetical protein KC731_23320 [Myxococcales bacterium]|nr:hypothetical protein [Myxococcales bacterium]
MTSLDLGDVGGHDRHRERAKRARAQPKAARTEAEPVRPSAIDALRAEALHQATDLQTTLLFLAHQAPTRKERQAALRGAEAVRQIAVDHDAYDSKQASKSVPELGAQFIEALAVATRFLGEVVDIPQRPPERWTREAGTADPRHRLAQNLLLGAPEQEVPRVFSSLFARFIPAPTSRTYEELVDIFATCAWEWLKDHRPPFDGGNLVALGKLILASELCPENPRVEHFLDRGLELWEAGRGRRQGAS